MPVDEPPSTSSPGAPSPYSPPYFPDRNSDDASRQSLSSPSSPAGPASGYSAGYTGGQVQPINVVVVNQGKSKGTAALLAFFLGVLGIHRFYLGYNGIGIVQLLLLVGGFLTCGITSIAAGLWAFIDFILILTGSISKDAEGNPIV
ncbi:MAG: TM2 domain-containing protein [Blastocatellia bacterium]